MRITFRAGFLICLFSAAVTISVWSYLPEAGEYQIVSIDPSSWLVTARSENGNTLAFHMHPSVFRGRCFQANLRGVTEGGRFSMVGPPRERFDRLQAKAVTRQGAPADEKRTRGRNQRPSTRGMQRYCVTDVDAERQTAHAESQSGEKIRFKIDVTSFRGYRFQVPSVVDLARGERFSLTTPNSVPVRCCTLEERLRQR